MTPAVRRAEAADLSCVHALDRRVSPVFSRVQGYERLRAGRGLLLVAGPPGSPVAFAAWSTVLDEATLINIAVAPGERRQGHAVRLLDAGREELAQRGIRRVLLEVRASNHGARALYRNVGFEAYGRREAYYAAQADRPAEDALLLNDWIGAEAVGVSA